MNPEDDLPRRADDPLARLVAEDLDRLSVAELDGRIVALEGEIARVRRKLSGAADHRASADALFRK